MKLAKGSCAFLILLLCLPVTGCWDRKEIEDVGIVLGIGFDKQDKNMAEQEKNDTSGSQDNRPSFSMVHQFVIPKQFAAKEGKSQKDYVNLIGKQQSSVLEGIDELSTYVYRTPRYEHLQIIVISAAVASSINLQNIIDFLMKNMETRRSIRVVISQDKTRDVFEKSGLITNPSLRIKELTDNYNESMSIAPALKLGDMSEKLTGKNSFIVPRVDSSGRETKIAGAAVVKGKSAKMIGWLDEEEVAGLKLLKGEKKSNGIITGIHTESGELFVYEIQKISSKIKPQIMNGMISFSVEINTEGKLRENWAYPGNAFDPKYIKKAEQATKASIVEAAEKALTKTKSDLKVDVAGFGKKFSIKYPRMWKKLKDDWDERFSRMPVEVNVKVKVEEFGAKGTKKH